MRIAKADLVPTDANLRDDYAVWAELVDACEAFMAKVNGRDASGHPAATGGDAGRGTANVCTACPTSAFTAAFGETRKVSWSATISFGGVTYSVPHSWSTTRCGSASTVTRSWPPTSARQGAVEVARHLLSTPGTRCIDDAHYPPRPAGPLNREPKATQHRRGRVPRPR